MGPTDRNGSIGRGDCAGPHSVPIPAVAETGSFTVAEKLPLEAAIVVCYIAKRSRCLGIGPSLTRSFTSLDSRMIRSRIEPSRPAKAIRLGFAIRSAVLLGTIMTIAPGCHDGPLYALKKVNPYFVMKEWRDDRQLGITDFERHQELQDVAGGIARMTADRQQYWLSELDKIYEHDPSAEMRRLAVVAAGRADEANGLDLLRKGLDDDDFKVRMEACRGLGKRGDEEAARLLATTVNADPDDDVRNSAIAALGRFQSPVAVDALRIALNDSDPSTQRLAVNSLRDATGKDFGDQPQEWIAALDAAGSDSADTEASTERF
ncbi:HEAT repeat protein [Crateriforma conspicua]|nr:HEAT repeat protein [Crateriforma conspicua]